MDYRALTELEHALYIQQHGTVAKQEAWSEKQVPQQINKRTILTMAQRVKTRSSQQNVYREQGAWRQGDW